MESYIDIPIVSQPENYKVELFRHQLAAIYKMECRESNNFIDSVQSKIGIFADITGYGKTNALIGLIIRDKFIWPSHTLYET